MEILDHDAYWGREWEVSWKVDETGRDELSRSKEFWNGSRGIRKNRIQEKTREKILPKLHTDKHVQYEEGDQQEKWDEIE